MTSKQAAVAGGFRSASSMSAALEPLLGATPRRAATTMSEAAITAMFVADIQRHVNQRQRPHPSYAVASSELF